MQCLNYGPGLTNEVLPLGVQISLVGQAALHDVGAVVGAGFDGGQAAAVGAVNQLHQGLRALWAERNLGRKTASKNRTSKQDIFKPESYILQRYSTDFIPREEKRAVLDIFRVSLKMFSDMSVTPDGVPDP